MASSEKFFVRKWAAGPAAATGGETHPYVCGSWYPLGRVTIGARVAACRAGSPDWISEKTRISGSVKFASKTDANYFLKGPAAEQAKEVRQERQGMQKRQKKQQGDEEDKDEEGRKCKRIKEDKEDKEGQADKKDKESDTRKTQTRKTRKTMKEG